MQNSLIKKRHLEEEVIVEGFLVHAQFGSAQADSSEAAAFPVSPVMHLHGRFEYMTAAHRNTAGETSDAAAALFGLCT
jgi:hypothetical protein